MKKLALLCFLVTAPVLAMKEYYSISRSIRALGMGGVFYGVSDDEYALFYNPAGVSLYSGKPKGMINFSGQMGNQTLSALDTAKKLSSKSFANQIDSLVKYQGEPIYMGGGILPYFLTKHLAVGLLLGDLKADYLLSGKELDSAVDLTAISDSGLLVSYGRNLGNEYTHVGLTAKGIYRAGGRTTLNLADIASGDKLVLNPRDLGGAGLGIDFDLGLMYDIPFLPFGQANRFSVVLSNLLASRFSTGSKSSEKVPGLTRTVSFGWHSVFSGGDLIDYFHVMADLAEIQIGGESDPDLGSRSGKILKHLNLGLEIPLGLFTVRTGIHQGYISLGAGFNFKYAKLDFASYQEELSNAPGRLPSRRYALTISLGLGEPNLPFKPRIKGVKIDRADADIDLKLTPKPPIEPKIDPALELTPTAPQSQSPQNTETIELKKVEPDKEVRPNLNQEKLPSRKTDAIKESSEVEQGQPTDETLYRLEDPNP